MRMKHWLTMIFSLFMILSCIACSSDSQKSTDAESDIQTTESDSKPQGSESDKNSDNDESGNGDLEMRVRLSFDGGEAIVRLEDNNAARDFLSRLPMTQTFEDFNDIEKICRLPDEIMTKGVEPGVDPDVADITLYEPWNTLVFYYEDYGYNDDLIPIGHVESGMELLAAMGNEFTVTMERMENDEKPVTGLLAQTTEVNMIVGDTVITAELSDNETSRAFLETLPRTLTMNRYEDREYYGRIEAITEEGESIEDFENGDVTYYPAGPSFAIFFDKAETSNQSGLLRMGKITSDLSVFNELGDTVEIRIDIQDE